MLPGQRLETRQEEPDQIFQKCIKKIIQQHICKLIFKAGSCVLNKNIILTIS
jgi:hypothetical protein